MYAVTDWEDVPLFDDEQAEAEFWLSTQVHIQLMENSVVASSEGGGDSVSISLRMDPRMLSRIKRMARSRYLNYQSMIKQWLAERLERESRDAAVQKNYESGEEI